MRAPTVCIGDKFGRLTVISGGSGGKRNKVQCRCECGNVKGVSPSNLTSGNTSSCGCLQREKFGDRNRTHGLSHTKTYAVWMTMWARCSNPNNESYSGYGAKGISVCPEWEDFSTFISDMGEAPEAMTIERCDGTKGYSKDNCKWATPTEQNRNRSNTIYLSFRGALVPLAEVADLLGMAYRKLYWLRRKALSKGLVNGDNLDADLRTALMAL